MVRYFGEWEDLREGAEEFSGEVWLGFDGGQVCMLSSQSIIQSAQPAQIQHEAMVSISVHHTYVTCIISPEWHTYNLYQLSLLRSIPTYPAIMTVPPSGVIGPNTFPTFSLANTNPNIVPENVNAPPRIIPAAYRYRLIPEAKPG